MRFGPVEITFGEKKALTDDQILEMLGTGVTTSTGINVGVEQALRVPAVAAAVRTIAEAAASLRIGVVSIGEDGTETPDPSHPAHALLNGEANEWTSSFELIRQLMVDALTRDPGGLAWVSWSGDQRPLEIIRYRPGIIAADYDADGSGKPSYRINGIAKPASQIIHLKGAFEKCPVSMAREAIAVAIVMEKHAAKIFTNGARPSGQIVSPKPLGDEGVKKMIKGFMASFGGAENSGGTPIFWDGTEFKAIAMSSVDAQFQQLRVFQLQEIGRAFNIPAILLGELSRATWSNAAEMQRMFLLLCLEPWLKALEGALRRALFTKVDRPNFAIRIERDDFSKVDLTVLATAISSLISSRVINPNEARDWLDMPERDGGSEFANPNTGSSQPGSVGNSADTPEVNAARKNEIEDDPDGPL